MCLTRLAAATSTKLRHRGHTTLEMIGGNCLIVKLVPHSMSSAMLFCIMASVVTVEACTHYGGKKPT